MPAKTGASHSFGYLTSVIVSSLLVEHVLTYVPSFRALSRLAGDVVVSYTSVPLSEEASGMLLIATILIFIWGVGFHLYRH